MTLLETSTDADEIIPGIFDGLFKPLIQCKEFRPCLYEILLTCTHFKKEELYNNIVFLNTELPKEKYKEKGKITDIIVGLNGNTINIEANSSDSKSLRLKNNNYHHKISCERFTVGSKLDDKYVYQILFERVRTFDDRICLTFCLKDEEGKFIDEKMFKRVYVCIAKAIEKYYNNSKLTRFEKILVMLNVTSKKELYKIAKGDEVLMDMAKKIDELNMDEGIIGLYDEVKMKKAMHDYDIEEALENGKEQGINIGKEQGINIGKEQGISIGEAKGITFARLETAKNLLKMKMSVSDISKATGLSKKDIKTLEKEI